MTAEATPETRSVGEATPAAVQQQSWLSANQALLGAQFARLRARLAGTEVRNGADIAVDMDPPAAIDALAALFGLTAFERDIVLLCAGVEMDSSLAGLCGQAQGSSSALAPTFGLALAALADPHWSALAPSAPLRRLRLIETDPARGLTVAPLRIDERILHYLAGVDLIDPRLASLLVLASPPETIADEHLDLANTISPYFASDQLTETCGAPSPVLSPVVHLYGDDPDGQRDIAALAAAQSGRTLFALHAADIPSDPTALEQMLLLVARESSLLHAALLVECGASEPARQVRSLIERVEAPAVITSRELFPTSLTLARNEVNKPRLAEQRRLWQQTLGPEAPGLNGVLDSLAGQFRMSARAIAATAATYGSEGQAAIWRGCRAAAQPRLEELAQRIVPTAAWDDLILPEPQKATLHQIAIQARHRVMVYETWGFAARGQRGLGVSALFAGESGTGKTLAAEVLAHELGLDLYRVDLSGVVSKYIGETEKNLRQVFDAAEEAGALLLFDEADALFGKRTDVKDSHDRYANIEVGYLLQRMETYQGLAVLTTNLKSSLDRAFARRLRFIVDFPFPGPPEREAIWQRAFPVATPTDHINPAALAQLAVPGGSIANIALNAAFLAAAADSPVTMPHLLQAAHREAEKNNRPIAETETRGWI